MSLFKKLEELVLIGCEEFKITDDMLTNLIRPDEDNLLNMRFLNLSDNNISETSLNIVSKKMPKLMTLKINRNIRVTGKSLRNFKNLIHLECLGCKRITNKNLTLFLIRNGKNLRYLDIIGCHRITSDFVKEAIRITKTRSYEKNDNVLKINLNLLSATYDEKIECTSPFLILREIENHYSFY